MPLILQREGQPLRNRLRFGVGLARAVASSLWEAVASRIRGDFEIEIRVSLTPPADVQPVIRSFVEEFQGERPAIGFGGDGAGNWHGSARVRHRGDVTGVRVRLGEWARG